MKSHKIVNFPLKEFDPSCYLAPRKHSICNCGNPDKNQSDIGRHGDGPPVLTMDDVVPSCLCDKNDPGKCKNYPE